MTKIQRIDGLSSADHFFLEASDECYFFGEYTARGGFGFSDTNDLVHSFKKPPPNLRWTPLSRQKGEGYMAESTTSM